MEGTIRDAEGRLACDAAIRELNGVREVGTGDDNYVVGNENYIYILCCAL